MIWIARETAGVVVAVLTGRRPALRLLVAGDLPALAGWVAGSCFILSLTLAFGVSCRCGEVQVSRLTRLRVWPAKVAATGSFDEYHDGRRCVNVPNFGEVLTPARPLGKSTCPLSVRGFIQFWPREN
jgi:hypothetical protein